MLLPRAVHEHARGQRLIRGGNPVREREAASRRLRVARFFDLRRIWIEHGREAGHNRITRVFVVALEQNFRDGNFLRVIRHQQREGEGTALLLQRLNLFGERLVLLLLILGERALHFLVLRIHLHFHRGDFVLQVVRALLLWNLQQRAIFGHELGNFLFTQLLLHAREKLVALGGEGLELFIQRLVLRANRLLLRRDINGHIIRELHRLEEGAHPVMVGVGERIVFVIVAAIARERHGEERARGRLGKVGHQFGAAAVLLVEGPGGIVLRAEAQVAGGDEGVLLGFILRRAFEQFVARELFANELVERLVRIERADDVVTKAPCLGPELIPVETVAVAVADHVQPEPGLMLAVARRGEELIHEAFVGVGTPVVQKRRQFFRRRRQAGEIKVEPTGERAPVGLGGGRDFPLREFGVDELINGVSG